MVLRDSCVLDGINYTNWEALIEQGYDQFSSPQVTVHAWLLNYADKDTYYDNYIAEMEAQEASAEALRAASRYDVQPMDDFTSGSCGITNLTQPFFITSIQQQTNGMTVTWQSCLVFRYLVFSAGELTTNTTWRAQAYVWGDAGSTSWTDTSTGTNTTHRFYKVRRLVGSQLSAGGFHSIVLRPDGTVWTWGLDEDFELGDFTKGDPEDYRRFPIEIADPTVCFGQTITNPVAVACAAEDWTLVVDATGNVWTWGENRGSKANLGNKDEIGGDYAVPAVVPGLSNVVNVAAGVWHGLALQANGSVSSWGDNSYGQLGTGGTGGNSSTPVSVSNLTQVVAVAAGQNHNIALRQDGNIWTWGQGDSGQLGDGSSNNIATPTMIPGISNVITVAAGADHSMALTTSRTVWTWGDNTKGQLGRTNNPTIPGQVNLLSNVVAIAAGAQFSLAVTSNGQVYAWGDNTYDQLGTNDASIASTNVPLLVRGLTNIVAVSAGRNLNTGNPITAYGFGIAMGLDSDGTERTWGWGENLEGEIGGATNGNMFSTPLPVQFCNRCDRCVQLGTSGSFTAHCTGTLVLYFNDEQSGPNNSFGDNGGSYTVTITGLVTNVSIPGDAAWGVPVGTVTNGGVYSFSASGLCGWDNQCATCWADANGPTSTAVTRSSFINSTNAICPMWQCFSLVGKIQ